MPKTRTSIATRDRLLHAVEESRDELVELTASLIRFKTVNPPGEEYENCAHYLGGRLEKVGFAVDYISADTHPEHTPEHPRVNVIGLLAGRSRRPLVHLNGHLDVVPVGGGWTLDPFAGEVRGGKIYGRGSSDMKAGIAAAVFAAEALRRVGVELEGSIEISGTVDEESGGFAGMGHLCETGRVSRERADHVIIPEPFGPDRICLGHRGVYWGQLTTHGHIAHGSMPFLGASAIDAMAKALEALRTELGPRLAARATGMPVVPEAARRASLNINAIAGGQAAESLQTPCVADRCVAVLDRRFLVEEELPRVSQEIAEIVEGALETNSGWRWELEELMTVLPTLTSRRSPLVETLEQAIANALGQPSSLVASPGTYDQKHVVRLGGVSSCVAYGPGQLEQAHQPDEWCSVDDLVQATQVLALTLYDLVAAGR